MIFPGRFSATTEKPVVLLLIGMRINRLRAVHKWLPVLRAMPRMIAELERHPEMGMLSSHLYLSGRIFLVQQYWENFDKLLAYAHEPSAEHLPAWRTFNQAVGGDGTVGIWHETYLVEPGKVETIYVNMPRFGLAGVAGHAKAVGRLGSAAERMHA